MGDLLWWKDIKQMSKSRRFGAVVTFEACDEAEQHPELCKSNELGTFFRDRTIKECGDKTSVH